MISATYVPTRITPEIGRRIDVRIAGAGGLEHLPFPVRFAGQGRGYRNADTGEIVTAEIIDWRDWRYAGAEMDRQRPGPTRRLNAGLAAVVAACEAPRRSWYVRERATKGAMGEIMVAALRSKIRASILQ